MASKRRCAAAMQTLWSAVMQRESRTRRRPETVLKPTPGARQRAHDILVFAGSSTAERTTVIARSSSRNKYTRKLRSPLQHAGQGQGSTCSTFILVVRQPFWFGVSRRAGHSSNRSRSISAVPDDVCKVLDEVSLTRYPSLPLATRITLHRRVRSDLTSYQMSSSGAESPPSYSLQMCGSGMAPVWLRHGKVLLHISCSRPAADAVRYK
jgi:hypothetical protein